MQKDYNFVVHSHPIITPDIYIYIYIYIFLAPLRGPDCVASSALVSGRSGSGKNFGFHSARRAVRYEFVNGNGFLNCTLNVRGILPQHRFFSHSATTWHTARMPQHGMWEFQKSSYQVSKKFISGSKEVQIRFPVPFMMF